MRFAYHPQSDDQTEVVNKCVEHYLRSFCGLHPKEWSKWFSLAEFWYNTSTHSSTHMTPFEVVYGQPMPSLVPYVRGTTQVDSVAKELELRQHFAHSQGKS